jgi:hypothetical protein
MENKRFYLKCKQKKSFIYDVIYDFAIMNEGQAQAEVKMVLCNELVCNYKDILVMNKNTSYNYKNREIVVGKAEKRKSIMMLVQPLGEH